MAAAGKIVGAGVEVGGEDNEEPHRTVTVGGEAHSTAAGGEGEVDAHTTAGKVEGEVEAHSTAVGGEGEVDAHTTAVEVEANGEAHMRPAVLLVRQCETSSSTFRQTLRQTLFFARNRLP